MRVAVIGIGAVGEACAHLLASRGTARSLVLANRSVDVADAVRMDLEQSRSWTTPLSSRAVEPWRAEAFRGCDVIVLTAGPRLRGDESRADKARETARLLAGKPGESIVESLARHAKPADGSPPVLLVITNPVEATVTWLAERTRWDRERIVGLGTTVETARFSRFLADRVNVDATSVWTEIIGEHGKLIKVGDEDAMQRRVRQLTDRKVDFEGLLARTRGAAADIRKLSEAVGERQAGKLIEDIEKRVGRPFSDDQRTALRQALATALSPPATRFAIAAAALEVVEAIGSDRGRVLPVSGFPHFADLPDVALAVPFVVSRAGLRLRRFGPPDALLREAATLIAAQVAAMREAAPVK